MQMSAKAAARIVAAQRAALAAVSPSRATGATRTRTGREGKTLEAIIARGGPGVAVTQFHQEARRFYAGGRLVTTAVAGPCDFGVTLLGGRSGVFDAKESKEPNRLKTDKKAFHAHQRRQLVEHGRAGAVAGLLCLSHARGRLYFADWRLLVKPRPSIPWDEMLDLGPVGYAVPWALVVSPVAADLRGGRTP